MPNTAGKPRRLALVAGVADLIQLGYGLRNEDPRAYLALAKQALSLAISQRAPRCVQGEAWSNFGNALRICGWLRPAARALALADPLVGDGTSSRCALHHRFWASWHLTRHDLTRTLDSLRFALQQYAELEDDHGSAVCLVKLAIVLTYQGNTDAAYETVLQAMPRIGQDQELLRCAWDVAIFASIEGDRLSDGFALLLIGREILNAGGAAYKRKVRWAEGLLATRIGRLQVLEDLRDDYAHDGYYMEAAQVALDIARASALAGDNLKFGLNANFAAPMLALLGVDPPSTAGQLEAARLAMKSQGVGLQPGIGLPSGSVQPPPAVV
jgi:hypothetical protein